MWDRLERNVVAQGAVETENSMTIQGRHQGILTSRSL